jgi:hypothetical protein
LSSGKRNGEARAADPSSPSLPTSDSLETPTTPTTLPAWFTLQPCPPLTHRFSRTTATLRGEEVAEAVVCTRCRLTWSQVLLRSPLDLAAFEAWLASRSSDG